MRIQRRECNWRWILLASAMIAGLMAVGWVSWQRMEVLEVAQRHADRPVGELLASNSLGQSFYSPVEGLHQVALVFGTYGHPGTSDVILHVSESLDATDDLVTARISGQDIENNAYNSFHFSPQRGIARRTLYFYLEAPDAVPGHAVTVYCSDRDVYQEGQAYYDGAAASNDLAFVAYYRLNSLDVAEFVLHQLSKQRPCLLGSPLFYVILIAGHFGLVGRLFVYLQGIARINKEEDIQL